jgi:hypothetical protein
MRSAANVAAARAMFTELSSDSREKAAHQLFFIASVIRRLLYVIARVLSSQSAEESKPFDRQSLIIYPEGSIAEHFLFLLRSTLTASNPA